MGGWCWRAWGWAAGCRVQQQARSQQGGGGGEAARLARAAPQPPPPALRSLLLLPPVPGQEGTARLLAMGADVGLTATLAWRGASTTEGAPTTAGAPAISAAHHAAARWTNVLGVGLFPLGAPGLEEEAPPAEGTTPALAVVELPWRTFSRHQAAALARKRYGT